MNETKKRPCESSKASAVQTQGRDNRLTTYYSPIPSNVIAAELKWRSELLWMTDPCTRRMEAGARARLRKQLAEIERGLRQDVDPPWNKGDPRVNAAAGEMFWHLAFILKEQERMTLILEILASGAWELQKASLYGPADLIGVYQFGLSKLGRTLPESWLSRGGRNL
jgi:hypothetical protein